MAESRRSLLEWSSSVRLSPPHPNALWNTKFFVYTVTQSHRFIQQPFGLKPKNVRVHSMNWVGRVYQWWVVLIQKLQWMCKF